MLAKFIAVAQEIYKKKKLIVSVTNLFLGLLNLLQPFKMYSCEGKIIVNKLLITIKAQLLLHKDKTYQSVLTLIQASKPKVNILQNKKNFQTTGTVGCGRDLLPVIIAILRPTKTFLNKILRVLLVFFSVVDLVSMSTQLYLASYIEKLINYMLVVQ